MILNAALFRQLMKLLPGQMAAMVDGIPAGVKSGIRIVGELVGGAELIGPAASPKYLQPLFAQVAQRHQLPAELLAAIAHVLTDSAPAFSDSHHVGLMALPLCCLYPHTPSEHIATVAGISSVDVDARTSATAAVRLNVETATALLASMIRDDGTPGGLLAYCALQPDPAGAAGDIVSTTMFYIARAFPAELRASIPAAIGALTNGSEMRAMIESGAPRD